jgi:hypothetical protein|tara:strand:+ start:214 stop:432 length:219 start_codon:yes stop_codon:yes gene_type:complete
MKRLLFVVSFAFLVTGCATTLNATSKSIAVFGGNPSTVTSVAQAHCAQFGKATKIHDISEYGFTTIFHCVDQ